MVALWWGRQIFKKGKKDVGQEHKGRQRRIRKEILEKIACGC